MRYPTWYLRWRAMRLNAQRERLLKRARELGEPMPTLAVPLMPDRGSDGRNHGQAQA